MVLRDDFINEGEVADKVTAGKKKFARRINSGYDPHDALESLW